MRDSAPIEPGRVTAYVPRRPRALTNVLVLTQIAAAITFFSRAMCLGELPAWMAVVPLAEGLVMGALLFGVATWAYRPSARAHRLLQVGYAVAIADATLWIVGLFVFVLWAQPGFVGSDMEGPFEGLGILAAALRAAWCAAKIKLCLWAQPQLRHPDVLTWMERVAPREPTRF